MSIYAQPAVLPNEHADPNANELTDPNVDEINANVANDANADSTNANNANANIANANDVNDDTDDEVGAVVASVPLEDARSQSQSAATTASVYSSARMTLSLRASHARSLVLSPQAFVVCGGYLRLRDTTREWRLKTWYCALLRAQLFMYPSQRDAARATNLVRRVALSSTDSGRSGGDCGRGGHAVVHVSNGHGTFHTYKHAFTFRSAHGDEYFCAAPTESDRAMWLKQLTQAAAAASATAESATTAIGSSDSIRSSNTGDDDDENDDEDEVAPTLRTVSSRDSTTRPSLSTSSSSSSQCFTCGTAFGLLRRQRRTCRSCARHFCRAHCSQYVAGVVTASSSASFLSTASAGSSSTLSSSSSLSSSSTSAGYTAHRSRVCDACCQRQHFASFLETFTATAIRLIRHNHVNVTAALQSPSGDRRYAKMRDELAIVVASAASFTVLNVLCLLKKYVHVPWMFTRSLCMLIPLYERNPSSLEEYWAQFLILFAPLLALDEPFSPSMQFFLRFVSAVCRRSNSFALRTAWACLAFSEDARVNDDRMTRSYLLLLQIACSSFDGGSSHVLKNLFAEAPAAQVDAITKSLTDFFAVRSMLREEIPKSLAARWFNALCRHEMELSGQSVLAAADSVEEANALLDVFDPSQTEYLAVLAQHLVRLPEGAHVDDECTLDEEDDAFMALKEQEFDAQAAFVEQLTTIAEQLRHVQPVEQRTQVLAEQLCALEQQFLSRKDSGDDVVIHAPLLSAGGGKTLDRMRLLRVVPEEGKVFSTRSRAPTMMVFEACPVQLPKQAQTVTSVLFEGSSVNPEDGDDDDDDDDVLDDELVTSAQFVSQRLRSNSRAVLEHKESVMLDALLCGSDESTSSGGSGGSSDIEDTSNRTSSVDRGAAPEELLVQEARETYEDSAISSFMASFRGGGCSAVRSKWKRRIRAKSPFGSVKGWTVVSLIAKSHDDLRQEVFAMQLMRNLVEIFENNELHRLYLRPYEILCTGANVGLIETLTDSQSVDSIKKEHGSIAEYFGEMFGSPASSRYQSAQDAFVSSVAASSLYCYLFQIKDRHNGNIMLGQRGHIMHIDFGFMLGLAPGGAFSLEDAPFKLTCEMVDMMGGLDSRGFKEFVELFTEGFLSVRREYIKILTLLHLTAQDSPFPCFQNSSPQLVLRVFRQRLFLKDGEDGARAKIRRLVDKSYNHWGTRQYDRFQYSSNGIMP